MERRNGERQPTSLNITASHGNLCSAWRGIELSVSGVLIESDQATIDLGADALLRLRIDLPGQRQPVRALARALRPSGTHQPLKFVWLNEVDRLSLAEHVDACASRSVRMSGNGATKGSALLG
jgi:hypothetical protein